MPFVARVLSLVVGELKLSLIFRPRTRLFGTRWGRGAADFTYAATKMGLFTLGNRVRTGQTLDFSLG